VRANSNPAKKCCQLLSKDSGSSRYVWYRSSIVSCSWFPTDEYLSIADLKLSNSRYEKQRKIFNVYQKVRNSFTNLTFTWNCPAKKELHLTSPSNFYVIILKILKKKHYLLILKK